MSMKAAYKHMTKNFYPIEQVHNFEAFMKIELKLNAISNHKWFDDSSLPSNWKTRRCETDLKRSYYLSPEGQQFLTAFTAIQHMVDNNYDQEAIKLMRKKMDKEGWEYSQDLPEGWQIKPSKFGTNYMGKYGEFFKTIKEAFEKVKANGNYKSKEVNIIKKIFMDESISLEDKYNWRKDEKLPKGWRVRRKLGAHRKMIEFYLASDGKMIRGKNSSIEYLKFLGGSDEEIERLKEFSTYNVKCKVEAMDPTIDNNQVQSSREIADIKRMIFSDDEQEVSSTTDI